MTDKLRNQVRTSLRIVNNMTKELADNVEVLVPPNYRAPWTNEYVRDVILSPDLTFEDLARRHGRSPASVNRLRCMVREIVYNRSYEAGDKRRKLIKRVLEELNYQEWDEDTRARYATRGKGRRSDRTQKALALKKGRIVS